VGSSFVAKSEEWSFAAAILWGHAIAKYFARSMKHPHVRREWAGFVVAALIVLGLVPALAVLVVLLSYYPDPVPVGLIGAQFIIFVLSVLAFIWFGALVGRR
jgi:uncharacterized RDD family membrane protein YckC